MALVLEDLHPSIRLSNVGALYIISEAAVYIMLCMYNRYSHSSIKIKCDVQSMNCINLEGNTISLLCHLRQKCSYYSHAPETSFASDLVYLFIYF